MGAATAIVLLGGCVGSRVDDIDQTNQVQERRISALENSVGKTLATQDKDIRELKRQIRAFKGQVKNQKNIIANLVKEQKVATESSERDTTERRKLSKNLTEQVKKMERLQLEAQNQLDKLQLDLTRLNKTLSSPMADLPAKTPADKSFRWAFYPLVSGELDVAADRFDAFNKQYPKDKRVPEALYRKGQAYYYMSRFDHALIPLYQLLEKYKKHKLAVPAQWLLARSLEETGDLKLAREFYAQLVNNKTAYASDATRRVSFINKLYPNSK